MTSALVNMGEFVAIGRHPSGRPWTLDVRRGGGGGGGGGPVAGTVVLEDEALAVSSGGGYRFVTGTANHLVQPNLGFAPMDRVVAVRAPGAMLADGLATACGLMERNGADDLLKRFPGTRIQTW